MHTRKGVCPAGLCTDAKGFGAALMPLRRRILYRNTRLWEEVVSTAQVTAIKKIIVPGRKKFFLQYGKVEKP
ncbi:hypothetical protein CLI78_03400 [Porphyromonas gingivalis]|nr:hypothetical protein HMPREF1553_01558 [Porphyromonas gingivalis F0568]PDP66625.1 hypothetical protein CLI78_03400 [Porphyromonas gingivalis]PDP79211.1 hypothetical protein CLI73_04695 [Porphyromonas gingivalis]